MSDRYRKLLARTSLGLLLTLLGAAPGSPGPPSNCASHLSELYSPRALRRMRTALELKLRKAHLERATLVQAVIEHRLSIARYLRLTAVPVPACRAGGTLLEQKPFP